MCCTGRALTAASETNSNPEHIDEVLVASPLPDGYWIEAFPFEKDASNPDIIAYGLGLTGKSAAIRLLMNPINSKSVGWKVNEIANLSFPVGMTYADLTGDGYNDLIICDRYGPSMDDLWDAKKCNGSGEKCNGGRVQWLRNPKNRDHSNFWEPHEIGNSTGMHRLQAGHFTSSELIQVMGFPIIPKSGDRTSPAPVLVFTPVYGANHSEGPQSWTKDVAFDSEFRLIHDVKILPKTNGGLDMILVAGREGIVLLWFDMSKNAWQYNVVGTGLPQSGNNPYWGSGSVDAFHGNSVAVYLRKPGAPKGASALKNSDYWERKVIDTFGDLNKEHTGTIHHVKAVQVGSTATVESFAIACIGAPAEKPRNQGVHIYTPTEREGVLSNFQPVKITKESAGRLAVANFSKSTTQQIGSISYYVPGYHVGLDPPGVRINSITPQNLNIVASRLNTEALLRIPRPKAVPLGEDRSLPFWILAGRKITLVVLPPGGEYRFCDGDAAKVIYGSITFDLAGCQVTRGIATTAKEVETTFVPSIIKAGKDGAVFIRLEALSEYVQGGFRAMSDVSSLNILPTNPNVEPNARTIDLPFRKVDTLSWAQTEPNKGLWNDFEFYNVTGFHVHFNDDSFERIVHMQAWTLGLGETARFHNHEDQSFCEIHYCLSNGGSKGGMRYFSDDYTDPIDKEAELTRDYVEERSKLLVVPDMHEHGPLWKIQPNYQAKPKLRTNGTVDYPWHAWLASRFGDWTLPICPPLDSSVQKYDVWMAFEFPLTAFQY